MSVSGDLLLGRLILIVRVPETKGCVKEVLAPAPGTLGPWSSGLKHGWGEEEEGINGGVLIQMSGKEGP